MEEQLQTKRAIEELKTDLLRRHFQYEEELGTGSEGKVVKVEHKIHRQKYAIKMLRKQQGENGNLLSREQRRELNILKNKRLCRQNIVNYYYHFDMSSCNNPYLCIVLELCGISLGQFVYNEETGGIKFTDQRCRAATIL
jgi:serine/threonine protein kinase